VGGGLCHYHISHLVHPNTLILDTILHAKKWLKNLANTFSDVSEILTKIKICPTLANFVRRWQVPLDKLIQLVKFDLTRLVTLPFCLPSNNLSNYDLSCDLSSQLDKSSYQLKCRTLTPNRSRNTQEKWLVMLGTNRTCPILMKVRVFHAPLTYHPHQEARFDLTKGLFIDTFSITVWYKLCRYDHSVLELESLSSWNHFHQ